MAFLLLGLLGVVSDDVAEDWELSIERLRSRDPDYEGKLDEVLDRERTSASESIRETLRVIDLEERLVGAGLSTMDLGIVRERLTP